MADAAAWKRKFEQVELEKLELEAALEDLTLDKEQLQEEKESLQEQCQDFRLDAETAQMEMEELRIELEDVQARGDSRPTLDTAPPPDSMELIQWQTQNMRLREALIRLREQSGLEKAEWTRQVRLLEKTVAAHTSLQGRVDELTAGNQHLQEQVHDLKDMVEQGAAFEMMVEDLSDRIMGLEEQNVALQTVVREMEEAAELTAEMEEVQADELKAMARDLESRDTLVRNLEEAIKMYVCWENTWWHSHVHCSR
jgi:dynactin 1